jgi:hypothetical protein
MPLLLPTVLSSSISASEKLPQAKIELKSSFDLIKALTFTGYV